MRSELAPSANSRPDTSHRLVISPPCFTRRSARRSRGTRARLASAAARHRPGTSSWPAGTAARRAPRSLPRAPTRSRAGAAGLRRPRARRARARTPGSRSRGARGARRAPRERRDAPRRSGRRLAVLGHESRILARRGSLTGPRSPSVRGFQKFGAVPMSNRYTRNVARAPHPGAQNPPSSPFSVVLFYVNSIISSSNDDNPHFRKAHVTVRRKENQ